MLPVGRPLSLRALLTRHLELGKPVYPRHLQALVPHTPCPPERQKLAMWAQGAEPYQAQVEARALSLLRALRASSGRDWPTLDAAEAVAQAAPLPARWLAAALEQRAPYRSLVFGASSGQALLGAGRR